MSSYVTWNKRGVMNTLRHEIEVREKMGAVEVAKAARSLAPWRDGHLATSIRIFKSMFVDGGWVVHAYGRTDPPEKFYASFLEYGTFKDNAHPFLVPALHQSRERFFNSFRNMI